MKDWMQRLATLIHRHSLIWFSGNETEASIDWNLRIPFYDNKRRKKHAICCKKKTVAEITIEIKFIECVNNSDLICTQKKRRIQWRKKMNNKRSVSTIKQTLFFFKKKYEIIVEHGSLSCCVFFYLSSFYFHF